MEFILAPFKWIGYGMEAIEAFVNFFADKLGTLGVLIGLALIGVMLILIVVLIFKSFEWIGKVKLQIRDVRFTRWMRKARKCVDAGDLNGAIAAWIEAEKHKKFSSKQANAVSKILYEHMMDDKGVNLSDDPQMRDRIMNWLECAQAEWDPDTMFMLASILISQDYLSGNQSPERTARGVSILKKMAKKNLKHKLAEESLAMIEEELEDVLIIHDGEPNMQAAALGHAESQYAMALVMMQRDLDKAMPWLQYASEQGYAPAQYRYGKAWIEKGEKYKYRGMLWLEDAAKQDHPQACFVLGLCYAGLLFKHTKVDLNKAEYWIKKAKELGYENEHYAEALDEVRKLKRNYR